jgi:hypothetical protein
VKILRGYGQRELRKATEQGSKSYVPLHAGQRRAEAVMDAVPEREVTARSPIDIE